MADISQIKDGNNNVTYNIKDAQARAGLQTKQDTIQSVAIDYQEDGGAPDASVGFSNGELEFTMKNMKMKYSELSAAEKAELKGEKGDQGDSAIWTEEGELLTEIAQSLGDSTVKPMSQKAITDNIESLYGYTSGQFTPKVQRFDLSTGTIKAYYRNGAVTRHNSYKACTKYIPVKNGSIITTNFTETSYNYLCDASGSYLGNVSVRSGVPTTISNENAAYVRFSYGSATTGAYVDVENSSIEISAKKQINTLKKKQLVWKKGWVKSDGSINPTSPQEYLMISRPVFVKEGSVIKIKMRGSENVYLAYYNHYGKKISSKITPYETFDGDVAINYYDLVPQGVEYMMTTYNSNYDLEVSGENVTIDDGGDFLFDLKSEKPLWLFSKGSWEEGDGYLTNISNVASSNYLQLSREYAVRDRSFYIEFSAADNAICHLCSVGYRSGLGPSDITVNMANGTITFASYNATFVYAADHIYKLIVKINLDKISIILTDKTNGANWIVANNVSITDATGRFLDYLKVYSTDGEMRVYDWKVIPNTMGRKCLMYITGDSITEGARLPGITSSWSYMICNNLPKDFCVISGRAGCDIINVSARLISEAMFFRPKYVMVMIGSNGGNTVTNLNTLIDIIESMGSIPIICHIPKSTSATTFATINSQIDNVINSRDGYILRSYIDAATSIDGDPNNGIDTSLFYDGLHPNANGCEAMFNRIKSDLAEIF